MAAPALARFRVRNRNLRFFLPHTGEVTLPKSGTPAVFMIKSEDFEVSASVPVSATGSGRTTALRRYALNRADGGCQQMYLQPGRTLSGRERSKRSAPSRVLSFSMLPVPVGRKMKLGLSIPGVDTLQARYRLSMYL